MLLLIEKNWTPILETKVTSYRMIEEKSQEYIAYNEKETALPIPVRVKANRVASYKVRATAMKVKTHSAITRGLLLIYFLSSQELHRL